ncbi:MAG TPA: ABC transporter permease subunit, partial [Spirochaetia bacterium]|nr:ABC transporter permease subunit [Spirochaetia bacterium]
MTDRAIGASLGEIRRLVRDPLLAFVVAAVLAALAVFILYPLASVIIVSLRPDGRWTLEIFRHVVSNPYLLQGFRNSILMGVLTAVIGTGIGFLFAFAVTRADVPFKRILHAVAIIPIVSPPFIGALAIIMLFGNNGFITWNLLRIRNFPIYGFTGLMIAQAVTFFPVAYLTLRGVLESINPTLEDAALDLGGSRFQVFRRVTLPLAMPGIASS